MSKGNKAQEMTDFDSSDMKNDLSVKELSSTPLTNRKIFHLASAIFIIITIFFIIYFSILLIVKPFESISLNYYALLNIEDLIEYQFVNWGSARMGFDLATFYSISFTGGSPTGYIIAALLIVTGVLCLISIDKIKSRGKGLLQAAVILNMLNGLFLVISTILSNIAYENIYLEDITEGSASLLNAAFRLEITFVVVIIISIILILIYAPFSKQVASLIPNLVSMGIGFIIFIVSSIFALNAMQLFFEYMLGIGGTPDIEQILVKLLPTTILAFLGYLFIIASFLFGMNKLHSKKAPKAYTTSFEIVTSLYLVSFFVEHLLTHLFGFLYP
ncbi:MAG: hypothetical protein H7641_15000, partial [Candidatus Heimdallarchaeota archaeon]|nr:hypothetical protein [Candidatus Heimdallarchaeota archaeon]MCK4878871.1 hypothetical protein [Candidatus Heimdallarchaeota archaeon]